jgi:hypothetical protein
MSLKKFTKQPTEVLDYDFLLADWFGTTGDTALSFTVTVPTGITLQSSSVYSGNTIIKLWISGGVDGITYKFSINVTTASTPARVKQIDFLVKVKDT